MGVGNLELYGEDGRLNGSFVYMLLCCDGGPIYVKIGLTDRLTQRMKALRTGCPVAPKQFAWVEVRSRKRARLLEDTLHRDLGRWRVSGEWFRFAPEDRERFNATWKAVFAQFVEPLWPLQWNKVNVEAFAREAERRQRYLRNEFQKNRVAWQDAQKACVRTP